MHIVCIYKKKHLKYHWNCGWFVAQWSVRTNSITGVVSSNPKAALA